MLETLIYFAIDFMKYSAILVSLLAATYVACKLISGFFSLFPSSPQRTKRRGRGGASRVRIGGLRAGPVREGPHSEVHPDRFRLGQQRMPRVDPLTAMPVEGGGHSEVHPCTPWQQGMPGALPLTDMPVGGRAHQVHLATLARRATGQQTCRPLAYFSAAPLSSASSSAASGSKEQRTISASKAGSAGAPIVIQSSSTPNAGETPTKKRKARGFGVGLKK